MIYNSVQWNRVEGDFLQYVAAIAKNTRDNRGHIAKSILEGHSLGANLTWQTVSVALLSHEQIDPTSLAPTLTKRQIAGIATIFFVVAVVAIVAAMILTGTITLTAPLFLPLMAAASTSTGLTFVSLAGYVYNRRQLTKQYDYVIGFQQDQEGGKTPEKETRLGKLPKSSPMSPPPSSPNFSDPASFLTTPQSIISSAYSMGSPLDSPKTPNMDLTQLSNEELDGLARGETNPKAMVVIAEEFDDRGRDKEAFNLYKRAADLGCVEGMIDTGECYREGVGVNKNMTEAVRYFTLAARANDGLGMYLLGRCFMKGGEGLKQDLGCAIKAFESAVKAGHPEASYRLAKCHHASKNYGLALKYYTQAIATPGCKHRKKAEEAVVWLAKAKVDKVSPMTDADQMYLLGTQLEKNEDPTAPSAALDYYKAAAEKGHTNAARRLENLSK